MLLHYRVFVRRANLRLVAQGRIQYSRDPKTKKPEARLRAPAFPIAKLTLSVLMSLVLLGFAPSGAPALFRRGNFFLGANDQFDNRHWRGVTAAVADFDNPGIAAGAVFETRRNRIEEFAHHGFVLNDCGGLTARMKIAALAQRDHPVNPAPQLFSFGVGGLYLLFAQ